MINRRHDDRASCLARQRLKPLLPMEPRIHAPATWKGGHVTLGAGGAGRSQSHSGRSSWRLRMSRTGGQRTFTRTGFRSADGPRTDSGRSSPSSPMSILVLARHRFLAAMAAIPLGKPTSVRTQKPSTQGKSSTNENHLGSCDTPELRWLQSTQQLRCGHL